MQRELKRLNWGCGDAGVPGWINSDLKEGPGIDITADIRQGLPLDSDSLDYIVSIHALPMISYPDLVPVLRELWRLLAPGGVLRLGLPDLDRGIQAYLRGDREYFLVPDDIVHSHGGRFIVHMLWYGYSVTLFTADFIEELLLRAGFSRVEHCGFRDTRSRHPDIVELDNREQESLFVEAVK
jgi:predicted SAM-dependent methyltransferase